MTTASAWSPPLEFEEYKLVRELGRGAMGEVWLAQDTLLDRPVAIKFVANEPDAAAYERIFVEARAIARLSHPNVVAIHRVGEVRRRPYFVSEFVRGEPLDRVPKPVEPTRLLEIAIGLARGLAAAHRRGVLHRDVKPANAILADDGEVKLLDFGLAKLQNTAPVDPVAVTLPLAAGDPRLTEIGDPIGTPLYMAPELWRGESATTRSDVYALGALLYELACGRAPHDGIAMIELPMVAQQSAPRALGELAPAIDPALAATIDQCLSRNPAERLVDGDAVREAIEQAVLTRRSARTLPAGNPYRGLAAFDAEHRALFFGRGSEMLAIVERLRSEPFVLVTGDSGVGKSSLCAAGVLPALAEQGFSIVRALPGRHPVRALAAALSENSDEAVLAGAIGSDPHALGQELRRRKPVVLFIDQLEELATLAEPAAAAAAAESLGALAAVRAPGVRLLATVRSDFLGRVAALPGLGEEAARAVFLLRPLGEEGLREAVTGPARAKNVRFESESLVSSLVDAGREAGGLPLLQFALAELWDARDETTRMIPAAALAARGGVGGALARHADGVIDRLPPIEREAARRILSRLVTVEGTRARRGERELVSPGDAAARAALDALVAGRLVVAREADGEGTYEVAHEALLTAWGMLRGWLDADAERRAVRQRVEQAAAEWERLGHARDALLGPRQLAEAEAARVSELAPREAAFLAASRAALWRRRLSRVGAIALVPVTVALMYGSVRARAARELDRTISGQIGRAGQDLERARAADRQVEGLRREAFARFDKSEGQAAEAVWTRAQEASGQVDAALAAAGRSLEAAFALDPHRSDVRSLLADLTLERALAAERDGRTDLLQELVGRLESYDDGSRRARLHAPATVSIETDPPGAEVFLEQAAAGRRSLGRTPLGHFTIDPGSYVLVFEAARRPPVRLPVLIARGEKLHLRVPLPGEHDVPPGFVYVPAGRFLYGSDNDAMRKFFFYAPPIHEVTTPAYLIERTEVTFADWIAYLRALPPAERARRIPAAQREGGEPAKLVLRELAGGAWELTLQPTRHAFVLREGEHIHYPERDRRADQDWLRFPVAGISPEDAAAYASWLDRTGRVPGARLCNDYEWERAARGADGRRFPSGDTLAPDDANFDLTYGRRELAFGPDEVGSHPGSRSPFGLDDTVGNVWELSRTLDGRPQARGGSWYHGSLSGRIENRQLVVLTTRDPRFGLRLCADARK